MKRPKPPARFSATRTGTPRLCVVEPFDVTRVPLSNPAPAKHGLTILRPLPARIIRFDPAWVTDFKDSG
jgi:hypothetical protein